MKTDNKLIAEFMGVFEKYPTGSLFINGGWWLPHEFKYHASWDWLMPVVGKIGKVPNIQDHTVYNKVNKSLSIFTLDIDKTYKAVVEFIKWYNQQQEG